MSETSGNQATVKEVFIFDMDGVIVDANPALKKIYLEFLADHGHQGSDEEFQRLSGPSMPEIMVYFKQTYGFEQSPEELLELYKVRLDRIYEYTPLIEGVDTAIKDLHARGITLVVASAASKNYVEYVLEKFNLRKYFTLVLSGDDVTKSKPDPAIYNKAREILGEGRYVVIEDSHNGLNSAKAAKMTTIFFNPQPAQSDYHITSMHELPKILKELYQEPTQGNTSPIATPTITTSTITVTVIEGPIIEPTHKDDAEIFWQQKVKENPKLHNGNVLLYQSHDEVDGKILIQAFVSQYKYVLAMLHDKIPRCGFPLAVSGLIIDKDNQTIFGQRSDSVTEYPGFFELIPAGGISTRFVTGINVDFVGQLQEEFSEETSMSPDHIAKITPLGLVFDENNKVYDIYCSIHLHSTLTPEVTEEFSKVKIVPLHQITEFSQNHKVVPTSQKILAKFQQIYTDPTNTFLE